MPQSQKYEHYTPIIRDGGTFYADGTKLSTQKERETSEGLEMHHQRVFTINAGSGKSRSRVRIGVQLRSIGTDPNISDQMYTRADLTLRQYIINPTLKTIRTAIQNGFDKQILKLEQEAIRETDKVERHRLENIRRNKIANLKNKREITLKTLENFEDQTYKQSAKNPSVARGLTIVQNLATIRALGLNPIQYYKQYVTVYTDMLQTGTEFYGVGKDVAMVM